MMTMIHTQTIFYGGPRLLHGTPPPLSTTLVTPSSFFSQFSRFLSFTTILNHKTIMASKNPIHLKGVHHRQPSSSQNHQGRRHFRNQGILSAPGLLQPPQSTLPLEQQQQHHRQQQQQQQQRSVTSLSSRLRVRGKQKNNVCCPSLLDGGGGEFHIQVLICMICLQVILFLGVAMFTDVFSESNNLSSISPRHESKKLSSISSRHESNNSSSPSRHKSNNISSFSSRQESKNLSFSSRHERNNLSSPSRHESNNLSFSSRHRSSSHSQRSSSSLLYDCSQSGTKIPLIIGGSDGSGTRAFVDVIKQLGVMVVADDKDTFDLHAATLFKGQGWPALVTRILNVTHSGNYEWDDLPTSVQTEIGPQVQKLVSHTELRCSKQHLSRPRPRPGAPVPPPVHRILSSDSISYGIKAPVSMLTLPVLTKFMGGRIKFLHVLRDGRDVALSSNQSPVMKFYNVSYIDPIQKSQMYSPTGNLSRVKAMQLWNDWNIQVYNWGRHHQDPSSSSFHQQQKQYKSSSNHISQKAKITTTTTTATTITDTNGNIARIDYLVMRSEDLLNPEKRLECLQKLAEFVGSTISHEQLCCMSRKATVDYGKSHEHQLHGNGGGGDGHKNTKNNHESRSQSHLKSREWYDYLRKRGGGTNTSTASLVVPPNNNNNINKHYYNKGEEPQHSQSRRLTEEDRPSNKKENDELEVHVKQRYGKWMTVLAQDTELSRHFQEQGAAALKLFGYEPHTEKYHILTSRKAMSFSICDNPSLT